MWGNIVIFIHTETDLYKQKHKYYLFPPTCIALSDQFTGQLESLRLQRLTVLHTQLLPFTEYLQEIRN